MFIKEVVPRLIKNSRRERTIEVTLKTYEGRFVSSAPSGKSRGKHEVEPYNLKGIDASFRLLRRFSKILKHRNFIIKKIDDLHILDELIERFERRHGHLGGNAWYVLHTVFLKAAAKDRGLQLWQLIHSDVNTGKRVKMPMPVGNCIGGGLHSPEPRGKKPDFQEFLLIPKEKTFARAVTRNIHAYTHAKTLLHTRKRNDENAWRTDWSNEDTLEILSQVAKKHKLRIGIDAAASTFYRRGYYNYKNKELIRDKVDQADYMSRLIQKYKLFYTEDPMEEEDFGGYKEILNATRKTKKTALIVGDDLTTTNPTLLKRAVQSKAINAIIIKPNQIGNIRKVATVVEYCKKHKITMIFSHRSGETMDDALADYCIGFGGQYMKAGIWGRERLIKLKRVMDIEKSLK